MTQHNCITLYVASKDYTLMQRHQGFLTTFQLRTRSHWNFVLSKSKTSSAFLSQFGLYSRLLLTLQCTAYTSSKKKKRVDGFLLNLPFLRQIFAYMKIYKRTANWNLFGKYLSFIHFLKEFFRLLQVPTYRSVKVNSDIYFQINLIFNVKKKLFSSSI